MTATVSRARAGDAVLRSDGPRPSSAPHAPASQRCSGASERLLETLDDGGYGRTVAVQRVAGLAFHRVDRADRRDDSLVGSGDLAEQLREEQLANRGVRLRVVLLGRRRVVADGRDLGVSERPGAWLRRRAVALVNERRVSGCRRGVAVAGRGE